MQGRNGARVSDEEFEALYRECPDLFLELSADGDLIIAEPAYPIDGIRGGSIGSRLCEWAETDRRGVVCGSSAGFIMPNGARRSPTASWT
ncbi:MAG: Uma2 family endonuclease [Acidobacteria bacterium]|nr:Uma2 family endonuclease [Acidobacteriota bacterium]